MKNTNTTRFLAFAAGLGFILLPMPVIAAQHEHGQPEHGERQSAIPQTYAEAVALIGAQLEAIEHLIEGGQLDRVHAEAAVIRDAARALGRLALKEGSGVPREAVKEVNAAARDLAAKFEPIDAAGDSGDVAATRKVYDEMVGLFRVLEKYVAHKYACPMGCEPGKVYGAPGRCPVCGMHLKKLGGEPYSVQVAPAAGISPGAATELTFTIRDPAGAVVKDLEVVHEKKLHLLIVSEDLSWYAHEHPEVQADGTLALSFTFPRPGKYVLFHDFTPPGVGMQVVPVSLRVQGTPPPPVPLVVDTNPVKQVAAYTVALKHEPLRAGGESVLSYSVSFDGRPVTDLEPYLGAMGHLVVISRDLKHFVHSHPLEELKVAPSGTSSPVVSFHANFPQAGIYKAWAQFQHKGHVITVPFVIEVQPASHEDEGGHHGEGHH